MRRYLLLQTAAAFLVFITLASLSGCAGGGFPAAVNATRSNSSAAQGARSAATNQFSVAPGGDCPSEFIGCVNASNPFAGFCDAICLDPIDQFSFFPPPRYASSSQFALQLWGIGKKCDDSQLAIGDNAPPQTTDSGHSVQNIDKIVVTQPNGAGSVYAFLYFDNNGSYWLQMDPAYGLDFWTAVLTMVPGAGAIASALNSGNLDAVYPWSLSEANDLRSDIAKTNPTAGVSITGCFSGVPSGAFE
ncbi:MAG: hypothetical protein ACREM2_00955 [Vulcanimicrobiaceae bacterium]